MTTIISVSAVFRMLVEAVSPVKKSASSKYSNELLFKNLLEQYGDMISKICFGYSRSHEEFEDLRQNTFINIWKGLGQFKYNSSIKTWIYRITLNTCVSMLRKRSREGASVDISMVSDIEDADSAKLEMIRELYELINQLPPLDKAIVMLWLDEYSYEEISGLVGIPRNTVATRLRRAKEKIHNYEREL